MQEKTDLQDSLHRELHLIRENFKQIKKHELREIERSSTQLDSNVGLFADPTERSNDDSSDDNVDLPTNTISSA